jgi:hypothetical protein
MSQFCLDRDILSIEPVTYLGGGFASVQSLIAGSDGTLSGATFVSAASDFTATGVQAGMVLATTSTILSEGSVWEILSVDSATQLTVSVLRSNPDAPAIAPPAANNLTFCVRTLAPRIADVSETLAEKLRHLAEVAGIDSADFADSAQLRHATACGTLAGVFLARADNARPDDANWIKAEHYRREFLQAQNHLRLAVDLDGDGTAESTRSLGNVTLRRV